MTLFDTSRDRRFDPRNGAISSIQNGYLCYTALCGCKFFAPLHKHDKQWTVGLYETRLCAEHAIEEEEDTPDIETPDIETPTDAPAKLIAKVIQRWVSEGYDTIGYSGEYAYPCHEEDISRGALGEYAPITSEHAADLLDRTLSNGYGYYDY